MAAALRQCSEGCPLISVPMSSTGVARYKTTPFHDCVKRRRRSSRQASDLVVLDMIMPEGIDGLATYQQIILVHLTQKAIVTSGFSQSARGKELQALVFAASIHKRNRITINGVGGELVPWLAALFDNTLYSSKRERAD